MCSYHHYRTVESQVKRSLLIFSKLHGIVDGRNGIDAIAEIKKDGRVGANSARVRLRREASFILQKSPYSG
jgi:hypothetical protein